MGGATRSELVTLTALPAPPGLPKRPPPASAQPRATLASRGRGHDYETVAAARRDWLTPVNVGHDPNSSRRMNWSDRFRAAATCKALFRPREKRTSAMSVVELPGKT